MTAHEPSEPDRAAAAKVSIRSQVAAHRDALIELSHQIHADPELCFQEHHASAAATRFLAQRGFEVETGVAGLDTAFEATFGSGDLVIGFCAEYDALPGIGHACGHNMICASSLGAGTGLAAVADEVGVTVKVFGTPAEEKGGGKILMLEAGVFDGVHAAMMAHPGPGQADLVDMAGAILAAVYFDVEFRGRPAHAAAAPHLGLNALDAVTVALAAIGLLRQQMPAGDLVHGIVTSGGEAPNVIPERTALQYIVRSETLERAEALEARVRRCFEAGALATGCDAEIRRMSPTYSHLESDIDLTGCYQANLRAQGRDVFEVPPGIRMGSGASTDMANLSLALPTIHPCIAMADAVGSPHQPEFAASCVTPTADDAVEQAALALAGTAVDAALAGDVRARLLQGRRKVYRSGVPTLV
jgi:amidohydrolase